MFKTFLAVALFSVSLNAYAGEVDYTPGAMITGAGFLGLVSASGLDMLSHSDAAVAEKSAAHAVSLRNVASSTQTLGELGKQSGAQRLHYRYGYKWQRDFARAAEYNSDALRVEKSAERLSARSALLAKASRVLAVPSVFVFGAGAVKILADHSTAHPSIAPAPAHAAE